MRVIYALIKYLLDWLVPRFVTEEVALRLNDDGNYEIVCAVSDLEDYEIPDATTTVTCFNLFGYGLFPKHDGMIKVRK